MSDFFGIGIAELQNCLESWGYKYRVCNSWEPGIRFVVHVEDPQFGDMGDLLIYEKDGLVGGWRP